MEPRVEQSPRAAVEPRDDHNQVEMLSTDKNSKSQVISGIASSEALTTKRPAWSRAWTEGVAPSPHPPTSRVGPIQRYETRTKILEALLKDPSSPALLTARVIYAMKNKRERGLKWPGRPGIE